MNSVITSGSSWPLRTVQSPPDKHSVIPSHVSEDLVRSCSLVSSQVLRPIQKTSAIDERKHPFVIALCKLEHAEPQVFLAAFDFLGNCIFQLSLQRLECIESMATENEFLITATTVESDVMEISLLLERTKEADLQQRCFIQLAKRAAVCARNNEWELPFVAPYDAIAKYIHFLSHSVLKKSSSPRSISKHSNGTNPLREIRINGNVSYQPCIGNGSSRAKFLQSQAISPSNHQISSNSFKKQRLAHFGTPTKSHTHSPVKDRLKLPLTKVASPNSAPNRIVDNLPRVNPTSASSPLKSFISALQDHAQDAPSVSKEISKNGTTQSKLNSFYPYDLSQTPSFVSERADPSATSQIELKGLSNVGNSCYINAVLQCLFVCNYFIEDLSLFFDILSSDSVILAFLEIARQLRRQDQGVVYTASFKYKLGAKLRQFDDMLQQDAHEFLTETLSLFDEEILRSVRFGPSLHSNTLLTSVSNPTLEETPSNSSLLVKSPVHDNFRCSIEYTIKCDNKGCDFKRISVEVFSALSLDMPESARFFDPQRTLVSISDLLTKFFAPTCVEVTCTKCKYDKGIVSGKFKQLPRVLILHLKRCQQYGFIGKFTKRTDRIRSDENLDVSFAYDPNSTILPIFSSGGSNSIYKQANLSNTESNVEQVTSEIQQLNFELKAIASSIVNVERVYQTEVSGAKEQFNILNLSNGVNMFIQANIADTEAELASALSVVEEVRDRRLKKLLLEQHALEEQKEGLHTLLMFLEKNTVAAPSSNGSNYSSASLKSSSPKQLMYSLISCVLHKGSTATNGHYVALTKCLEEKENRRNNRGHPWIEHDDSYACPLSQQEALRIAESEGYLFFYNYVQTI